MSDRSLGFGRLYAPDARDRKYTLGPSMFDRLTAATPPSPRRQPYKEGPILDQGQTPRCVGYSARGVLQAAPIMVKPGIGPTPDDLYGYAQKLDEWPGENYDGSSVRGGQKALQSLGYISNYLWLDTRKSAVDRSVLDLISFMQGGYGTAIIGINWYLSMDDVDSKGRIVEPATTDQPVGGHATRLNWYDEKRDAFLLVNSWGHYWGQKVRYKSNLSGTAWMSRALLRRLMVEDGECTCPTEVKVK